MYENRRLGAAKLIGRRPMSSSERAGPTINLTDSTGEMTYDP
jgi:hypothetical protein